MTTEANVVEKDLDDDFNAGFDQVEAPTPTPEVDTEAEPVVETELIQEPPKYAKITEKQLEDLLAAATAITEIKADSKSRFDNAFGQLGGLKQRIENMQSATPAGQSLVATAEDFAELRADYPDFADKQMAALNKVLGKLKGTGQSTGPDLQETIRQEIVDSSLEAVFPGWKDEVKTPAFTTWLNAQPADVKELAASDSVGHASRMLRLYEKAKDTPVQKPKPNTRQAQIEAAVQPKGGAKPAPSNTDDDEFTAGFNGTT